MKCVIDIPKKAYEACLKLKSELDEDGILGFCLINAVANCELLPKGHGDLIDRNSVNDFLLPKQDSDTKWCATGETIKQLIRDAFDKAPTIIEADETE
jgi:hypothetical protein